MLAWSFRPSVDISAASRFFTIEELSCVLSVDLVNKTPIFCRIRARFSYVYNSTTRAPIPISGPKLGFHRVAILRLHANCHANCHQTKILLKISAFTASCQGWKSHRVRLDLAMFRYSCTVAVRNWALCTMWLV